MDNPELREGLVSILEMIMHAEITAWPDPAVRDLDNRILVGRLLGEWIDRDSTGPFRVYLIADGSTGRHFALAATDVRLRHVIEMEDPRPGDLLVLVRNTGALPELLVVRGAWFSRVFARVRFLWLGRRPA